METGAACCERGAGQLRERMAEKEEKLVLYRNDI